jgi:GNAT superfamily N-acetyltransferase
MNYDQSAFRLREASTADIAEIVRITNLAYLTEAFCICGDRTDLADITQRCEAGTFLVIDDPADVSTLIGSVYTVASLPRGYLGMLAVAPHAQGHGIARHLVTAVEHFCRDAGCSFLDLAVVNLRTELFAFYAKLGFAAVDVAAYPAPERMILPLHLVRMTKALVAPEKLPAP